MRTARLRAVAIALLMLAVAATRAGAVQASLQLTAGEAHTCVVMNDGRVKCWGSNQYGQLGVADGPYSAIPVVVPGLTRATAISAGLRHTCAVDGTSVKCWGDNGDGQLGDGTTTDRAIAVSVPGLPAGFFSVGAGERHTCAVAGDFSIRCWGYNDDGELGDGTRTPSLTPVGVSGIASGAGEVVAGQTHTCARIGNAVKCWGDAAGHKLGDFDPAMTRSLVPVAVTSLSSDVADLAAGANHTCALLMNNTVRCWGENGSGQLGDGTTTSGPPVTVYNLFVGNSVPGVSVQPRSITVTAGQVAKFTSQAYCAPGPRGEIIWQVRRAGGGTFVDIPASSQPPSCSQFAADRSYSLIATLADDQSQFRAVFTNSEGSTASDAATLTVVPPPQPSAPAVVTSPASRIVTAGSVVSWSATATGFPAPSVQWQYSTNSGATWNDIALGRSTSYTFTAAVGDSARQFRVVFTNAAGTATTAPAGLTVTSDRPFAGDLDGDGRSDLVLWRPNNGGWYALTSGSGFDPAASLTVQWGSQSQGDIPLLGDIDGDGKSDFLAWRSTTGTWFWLTSSSRYLASRSVQWGTAAHGDARLLGDIDGDGKADLIIWRPGDGTWYWLTSSTGYDYARQRQLQWGAEGDTPLAPMLDADGLVDLAVWRPGSTTWFWLTSGSGYSPGAAGTRQWGSTFNTGRYRGDIPAVK